MKHTIVVTILFYLLISPSFADSLTKESEAIGKYHAGCVRNPMTLPIDGYGYQVIRPSRKRNYGHRDLIVFIKELSKRAKSNYNSKLLIADITKKNGGPMPVDHSSHQTGLDADILYIHKANDNNERLSVSERERMAPESVLNGSKTAVDLSKWSWINGEIMKKAANDESVDRIFVNPVIKKELCTKYRGQDWLRKLRPWWGHDGHFHVRISCPENDTKCVSSPPLPEGTGCGSDLSWWFSKKAQEERIKNMKKPKKKKDIKLPDECNDLI